MRAHHTVAVTVHPAAEAHDHTRDVPSVMMRFTKFFHPLHTHTQHYEEKDLKLRRFVPIIRDSVVYPVILDSKRTVCSLPPIINAAMPAVSVTPITLCQLHPCSSGCGQCAAAAHHRHERLAVSIAVPFAGRSHTIPMWPHHCAAPEREPVPRVRLDLCAGW